MMDDLETYRGTGQFGRAYEIMLGDGCSALGPASAHAGAPAGRSAG
jgi:hypothetical protein